MNFKQFYLGCLAHASYYIGSGREAAIVDPQRDAGQYLAEAEANGQQIKYIIETHPHADFVGGHAELAAKTGAQIIFGARAEAQIPHLAVGDADELRVGNARLKFLETPGHTPEGISILVEDAADENEPKRVGERKNQRKSERAIYRRAPQRRIENARAARAVNLTLSNLENLTENLDAAKPAFVICQGGYRSSAATSILEKKVFGRFTTSRAELKRG